MGERPPVQARSCTAVCKKPEERPAERIRPERRPAGRHSLHDLGRERRRVAGDRKQAALQDGRRRNKSRVHAMRLLAENATPELKGLLVPMCVYHGGVCHEMNGGCGRGK